MFHISVSLYKKYVCMIILGKEVDIFKNILKKHDDDDDDDDDDEISETRNSPVAADIRRLRSSRAAETVTFEPGSFSWGPCGI